MSTLLCEVGLNDWDCEAPASAEETDLPIRTRCRQCGQRACKSCSRVVKRRRICADCNGDYWPASSEVGKAITSPAFGADHTEATR